MAALSTLSSCLYKIKTVKLALLEKANHSFTRIKLLGILVVLLAKRACRLWAYQVRGLCGPVNIYVACGHRAGV